MQSCKKCKLLIALQLTKQSILVGSAKKAFTCNTSIKRHRLHMYMNTMDNCLTCNTDLVKHSMTCMKNKLEAEDTTDFTITPWQAIDHLLN